MNYFNEPGSHEFEPVSPGSPLYILNCVSNLRVTIGYLSLIYRCPELECLTFIGFRGPRFYLTVPLHSVRKLKMINSSVSNRFWTNLPEFLPNLELA